MRTSVRAFQLALVCFLIPFAFAFEPGLLGQDDWPAIAMSGLSLCLGTAGWAVALVGYWMGPVGIAERILVGATAAGVICFPTGSTLWLCSAAVFAALGSWLAVTRLRRQGRRE